MVDPSTTNGSYVRLARRGLPHDPVDRSHLLRRSTRFPFPAPLETTAVVRIRRARRVSASFSGIPPLARDHHR